MWAAGVVLVLSVAAWFVSLKEREWHPWSRVGCWLSRGELAVYWGAPDMMAWEFDYDGLRWARWRLPTLRFREDNYFYIGRRDGACWMFTLPLWLLASCGGLVLGGGAVIGWRHSRNAHDDRCPTCGYDLIGIDGVCPECGSGQPGRGVTPAKGTDDV
jgi:hypothetical protein